MLHIHAWVLVYVHTSQVPHFLFHELFKPEIILEDIVGFSSLKDVKLSLCLIRPYGMKTYEEMEV